MKKRRHHIAKEVQHNMIQKGMIINGDEMWECEFCGMWSQWRRKFGLDSPVSADVCEKLDRRKRERRKGENP